MDESSLVGKLIDIFVGPDHHDTKSKRGTCTQACNRTRENHTIVLLRY